MRMQEALAARASGQIVDTRSIPRAPADVGGGGSSVTQNDGTKERSVTLG